MDFLWLVNSNDGVNGRWRKLTESIRLMAGHS
jgi:hypothetical protein